MNKLSLFLYALTIIFYCGFSYAQEQNIETEEDLVNIKIKYDNILEEK